MSSRTRRVCVLALAATVCFSAFAALSHAAYYQGSTPKVKMRTKNHQIDETRLHFAMYCGSQEIPAYPRHVILSEFNYGPKGGFRYSIRSPGFGLLRLRGRVKPGVIRGRFAAYENNCHSGQSRQDAWVRFEAWRRPEPAPR